ncbi:MULTISPECIES: zinc-dependent alcohol dehydrogenase [Myxococcus]|uniref:Glutathione-dependent formaldehyde dehydrogenase n=1 Tax=Myxococcus virescens TaxID=83456 RepID=A0A511HMR5_9BACT|nr:MULTISPECIES: zinc-dependent alcohol dehydrogenase [Myxococcus]WNZ62565.1 glutathione-dependent formaldehyde dehydrogenase [Myxococcus sp. MxC21-1]GEL73799.1 glutathione-dependent formaldehyde dehydrogenase [Myxococcus virescens]SDE33316.1 Threonine dehydrogenase [Myxococcus virescens]
MRALCWNGINDLGVETVGDPRIVNPHDVILQVRMSTTCGSDLHFIDGYIPTMRKGDVIGHEFMGTVVEKGPAVKKVQVGDRVVVPSFIGCGSCWYCQHDLWSLCDNTNPKGELQEPLFGYQTAGIYGYTHAFGGYAGAHAQFVRVPHADNDCFRVPEGVTDEQALFLSDAVPTGYMGADFCDIQPGQTVAVWGCGGVGLMAQKAAFLLGAERVIGIDRFPERLKLAREKVGAETISYEEVDSVLDVLKELTGGRGPDACIDAVGMEAHGTGVGAAYDRAKQAMRLQTDRGQALRQAILACRKGGILSVVGVYGFMDAFPLGAIMNKGLTVRAAQQHGQKYLPRLLEHVVKGELDPSFLATHRFSLEDAPKGYELFKKKQDGCVRAVFLPN